MVDGLNNFIQFFNEVFILMCAWSLFLFTDYVPDPKLRHSYGENFLYIVALNFAGNMVFLFTTLIMGIRKGIKNWWTKRLAKKQAEAAKS